MELDTKTVVVIALIIVGLFAGGLGYIFSESNNQRVTLDLMQQYINTEDPEAKAVLAADIKGRLARKRLALTSKASYDSFEAMLKNAQDCDVYASRKTFNPRETETEYENVWRECMNHPEVLTQK
jgi:hypothetical protein